jgi:hypothetical protein
MVDNSTDINKMNNHLSLQTIEHKQAWTWISNNIFLSLQTIEHKQAWTWISNDIYHMSLEIQVYACLCSIVWSERWLFISDCHGLFCVPWFEPHCILVV